MTGKPPAIKYGSPKFRPGHPLVAQMIELAALVLEHPRGSVVGRTWHADGKRWDVKPPPLGQRCSDDDGLDDLLIG